MSFALSFYGLGGAIQSPDMLPLLIGPPGQGAGDIPGGIDNSLLSDMATATFKGRIAAGTGAPQDLTATQATSLLNVATVSLKGLMSASDFAKLAGIANGATANTGTVTSVAITAPTGFAVTGSPITGSGTLALAFASGYSLPTTAKQTEWDTAFSQTRQWNGGATGLVAATGRASLGGTTVGSSFFTLANPGAITFPRINADNTVTALSASDMRTAIGAGTGSGTVTTVSVVTANGVSGSVANATSTPAITLTLGAITPTSVAATGNVTGANLSGTNTGDQTTITGNAGTATTLQTGRTISITGDATWTSGTFNGSANVTAALTLATVNSNVDSFGSATQVGRFTVNAKGLVTAASNVTVTPAASSITGGAAITRTNDTNVTLTLGGTPNAALLADASLTLGWTGTLAVARGGTGASDASTARTNLGLATVAASGSFADLSNKPGIRSNGQGVVSANLTVGSSDKGAHLLLATGGITITLPSSGFSNGEGVVLVNISGASITLSAPGGSDFGTTLPANASLMVLCDGGGFWRQMLYSTARL